jgi:hypothetical protein
MDSPWYRRIFDEPQFVRFETPMGLAEAVSQLAAETETSSWRIRFSEYMLGRVSANSVRLRRVVPYFRNDWKPVFEGRFEEAGGRVALVGIFGASRSTRIFMYVFISFGLLWSVFAFLAVSMHPDPTLPVWFPVAGFGMAVVGVLMSRGFGWLSRGDIAWLKQKIAAALHAKPANYRLERP